MSEKIWNPFSYLKSGKYVFCILNQPISNCSFLVNLWNKSLYRVTVDGGASIWSDIIDVYSGEIICQPQPDLITGDFDSVQQNHLKHFETLGSRIIPTPDQDNTDFTKCLQQLEMLRSEPKMKEAEAVFVFVENSGRLDQIMGNVQTLFLAKEIIALPVFLISSSSLTWLLSKGQHKIKCKDLVTNESHCGLIPLDGKSVVTTTGLKWNLSEDELRFGNVVSTSNGFDCTSEFVNIDTSNVLLWTMDLKEIRL